MNTSSQRPKLMRQPTNVYLTVEQREYVERKVAEMSSDTGFARVRISDVIRRAIDQLMESEPLKGKG